MSCSMIPPGHHDRPRTPWLPPVDWPGLLACLLVAPRYLARTRTPDPVERRAENGEHA